MVNRAKDAAIVDGFNTQKKGVLGIREIKKKIAALADKVKVEDAIEEEESGKNSEKKSKKTIEIDDKVSTHQMLQDMRSVYKTVGGRGKLLKLIKDDDKLLMTMVKELLKIESSLLATEIRNKDTNVGGGNQVTFVILKGLQNEDEVMGKKESAIDLEQLADSINPSAVPKIDYKEEMARPE